MNQHSDFDALDDLLNQPALIADRGFTQSATLQFSKTVARRNRLFFLAGAAWLILVTLFAAQLGINIELPSAASLVALAEQQTSVSSLIGSIVSAPLLEARNLLLMLGLFVLGMFTTALRA